jgi:hypothetical protein
MNNHKACKSVTEDQNYKFSIKLLGLFYKFMVPEIFHNGATYEAMLILNGEATHT